MSRFDKANAEAAEKSGTRSSSDEGSGKEEIKGNMKSEDTSASFTASPAPHKRTNGHISTGDDFEMSEDVDVPSPAKKIKKEVKKEKVLSAIDEDARIAAMLQAEENSRARPSRSGVKKSAPVKRKKAVVKKSKDLSSNKVNAEDDSDVESGSGSQKRKVNRNSVFHVSVHFLETEDCLLM
jgi:upstream activation factor subunit UAF30